MTRYFDNCKTLEELKATFKKLAIKNHPDCGGSEEVMKEINRQYDEAFPRLKNIHVNKDGQKYEKENDEAPDWFRNIIEALLKMQGVDIEIIGSFIWVSGNTREHKDALKGLGFQWHSTKKCWYKAPEGYRKASKAQYSMDDIRNMYGVQYEAHGKKEEEKKQEARKQIA